MPVSISAGGFIRCARHQSLISQDRRAPGLTARAPAYVYLCLSQAAPLAASPTGVLTGREA